MEQPTRFRVSANGAIFGVYVAETEQAARDACAIDAGYDSEAEMVERLGAPSDLQAVEVTQKEHQTLGVNT